MKMLVSHHNLISSKNAVGLHYSDNPKDLEIYCRKLHKVTNPPEKICFNCEYMASHLQGHGCECVWEDVENEKKEPMSIISHVARYEEFERVDKLIKQGVLVKG